MTNDAIERSDSGRDGIGKGRSVRYCSINGSRDLPKQMHANISLRPATLQDAPLFYGVVDQTMREFNMATWGTGDEERIVRESLENSQLPHAKVVQAAGQDAGVLVMECEPTHLQIRHIYLLSEYQRQGIGTQSMAALVAQASAAGKPLRLRVLTVNPAKQFYEKLGFVVTKKADEFFYVEHEA